MSRIVLAAGRQRVTAPPSNTVAPVISLSSDWATLACTTGTWTNTPTSYAYQWKRAGVAISGATSSTYSTTGNDGSGHTDYGPSITCEVTATNAGGASSPAASNALAYTPSADSPSTFFDVATLSDGAVSSFADQTGAVTMAQATGSKQPVKAATSLNGTPGITFDGVDDHLVSASTQTISGNVFTTVVGLIDTTSALTIVEYFVDPPMFNVITQSGWALAVNNPSAGRVAASAHGGGGSGAYGSASCAETLATAKVVTLIIDTAAGSGTGVAKIRVDGVDQTLTNDVTSCVSGALGTRSRVWGVASNLAANPWAGVRGCSASFALGTATAAVQRAEQFIAWRSGKSPL